MWLIGVDFFMGREQRGDLKANIQEPKQKEQMHSLNLGNLGKDSGWPFPDFLGYKRKKRREGGGGRK